MSGAGVVPGVVTRLRARRVPQIGWNRLEAVAPGEPLFRRAPLDDVYFANSYVRRPAPGAAGAAIAWATHEDDRFVAAVRVGDTVGVQFHPEKSSAAAVAFARAWVEEAREGRGYDGREGERRASRGERRDGDTRDAPTSTRSPLDARRSPSRPQQPHIPETLPTSPPTDR